MVGTAGERSGSHLAWPMQDEPELDELDTQVVMRPVPDVVAYQRYLEALSRVKQEHEC